MKSGMCTTTCDRGFHICCSLCWVLNCDDKCNFVKYNFVEYTECELMKEMEVED